MSKTGDTGETTSNYLEKITPKDLVMFSSKTRKVIAQNDFKYLGVDYPIEVDNEENAKKIWGLPYVPLTDPVPLGLISGFSVGSLINYYRKRPTFSSKIFTLRLEPTRLIRKFLNYIYLKGIHLHLISTLVIGASLKLGYDYLEKKTIERELVVWDYVKKHPKDFPEVFNPPKQYKDLLLPWKPVR